MNREKFALCFGAFTRDIKKAAFGLKLEVDLERAFFSSLIRISKKVTNVPYANSLKDWPRLIALFAY